MVYIHTVRKRTVGFSNVKSIILSTHKLVDEIHGLAVSMGSNESVRLVQELVKELVGW